MNRAVVMTSSLRVDPARVAELLARSPEAIFGPRDPATGAYADRLGVPLGAAGVVVTRAVVAGFGSGDRGPRPRSWDVSLRATRHEDRYPVFEGTLDLIAVDRATTRLELRGSYAVPLGPVGRLGDAVVGHHAAELSLRLFLDGLSRRIDEALRSPTAGGHAVAPAAGEHPDLYIG